MSKLAAMKERYEHIPVPEELDIRLRQEIQKSRKQQEEKVRSAGRVGAAQDKDHCGL